MLQGLHASVTVLALALFATNSFHCWAHMQRPPAFAGWLHRWRLAIPADVHAVHHRAAHDCSYCVTSGWLNPLLDRVDFFRRLEAALASMGIEACRGDGLRTSPEEPSEPAPEGA
jgi:ubiquitin-conjugating enzyme E2 variant